MKRNASLWMTLPAAAALLAFAAAPATAQLASLSTNGKIHGQVTNPTGAPQTGGTVTLVETTRASQGPGLPPQTAEKGTAKVDQNGNFSIEAPAGTYTLIYRSEGMAANQQADELQNVKVVAGQDTAADIDMSRKEYIDKLPPEQRQQLEELRKKNSDAMKANEVIKRLNADLKTSVQDVKDADAAPQSAAQQLGANASKADVDAKVNEIKTAKYTEIETMMKKDTADLAASGSKVDGSVLWAQLGQAQVGLKQYDDAIASYKKALDMQAALAKQNPQVQGMANSGLGEAYARTGKVPEANAAFDEAAKVNPTSAAFYYRNEAVIFFQMNNADAQVAAANEALKADPNQAVMYYIIGQGLVQKATIDPKTSRIVLPPGCAEAYQKYLELAPTGPYAADAKGILDQAGEKINSSYKAGKKS
jgi:tetratricopeptide (TPR) repeat protein